LCRSAAALRDGLDRNPSSGMAGRRVEIKAIAQRSCASEQMDKSA
jgi:hypothetical protein